MDQAMSGSNAANSYDSVKRIGDFGSALILLVLFSPLMAVVAVLIKMDSRGPVFFRQHRIGRNGIPFRIVKFRTMVTNAEVMGPQVTSSDDERVTRLGRLLRATKIDELPQLLNVLTGDMSLVGPRPQVQRYVDYFPETIRRTVLSVPPGITGPTALAFRHEEEILDGRFDREEFYITTLLPIKCQLDYEYVLAQSFLCDCQVLLRTLVVFIGGLGHRLLLRPMGRRIEMVVSQSIAEELAQAQRRFAYCVVEVEPTLDDRRYACIQVRDKVGVSFGE